MFEKARVRLVAFVAGLRIIENVLYYRKFGPLSSSAGDIWFFIGVARGHHHLFAGDPLQWFLPLLGNCRLEVLFGTLLLLSNLLHLLAVLLLFGFLREAYQDERAAFWASAIYACFQTSCVFTTGSFHHQQEALPLLIGLMWVSFRFLRTDDLYKRMVYGGWASLLAILGLLIGPDVWVLLAAAPPCFFWWKIRKKENTANAWILETSLLVLWIGALFIFSPLLEPLFFSLAQKFRNIDLSAQRQLKVGDLLPFTRSTFAQNYSWVGILFWIGGIWAWTRCRFVELGFVFTALVFAAHAARFYFVAEIGFAFLVAWALSQGLSWVPRRSHWAGVLLLFIFLSLEIWRGFSCHYPGALASVFKKTEERSFKILCTPTYGFFVREAMGGEATPTSDHHHLKDNAFWMGLLAKPAEEAVREIKDRKVDLLFLTSHDFNTTVERSSEGGVVSGVYASGGLQEALGKIKPDDLPRALVCQAFNPVFQQFPVPGISLVTAAEDPATRLKAVLYRIE